MRPFNEREAEKEEELKKQAIFQKWVILDDKSIAMQTTTVKQTKIFKRNNSPTGQRPLTGSLNPNKLTKHGDKKEEYEESTSQTMSKANAFSKFIIIFI